MFSTTTEITDLAATIRQSYALQPPRPPHGAGLLFNYLK